MRIGIDLMGSDHSPAILFQAIENAIRLFPFVHFHVFATQHAFEELTQTYSHFFSHSHPYITFQIVTQTIEMQDEPLVAIRQKKESSLILGLKLLKKQELDAFVSAGNTGALVAGAAVVLPLMPGIKRPGLLAVLPTQRGKVGIIDVGGNIAFNAFRLAEFSRLGIAYQRCVDKIESPRMGLLNIGVESKKGTDELRHAYQLLQEIAKQENVHFVGNIEGKEVFQGHVDLLITDGFTGNIFLKSSEGASALMLKQFQDVLQTAVPDQAKDILLMLTKKFNDEEYQGALVCGVDGVVVKCHGQTSPEGLCQGIQKAIEWVKQKIPRSIKEALLHSNASLNFTKNKK